MHSIILILIKKEVEIWLRTSRFNGNFVADTQLYERGGETGNFKIPFKTRKSPEEVSENKQGKVLSEGSQVSSQLMQNSSTLGFKHHLLYSVIGRISYSYFVALIVVI